MNINMNFLVMYPMILIFCKSFIVINSIYIGNVFIHHFFF